METDNNQEEEKDDIKYGELSEKLTSFFEDSYKDLKNLAKEEKIFKGESFFDLFEKNIPEFNNPLKGKDEFRATMDKLREKLKRSKVTEVRENSIIREEEKAFHIEVTATDYDKSDINITVKAGVLTIKAEAEADASVLKKDILTSYAFDEDTTDFKSITSSLEKGLLKIVVPKKEIEEEVEEIFTININ